MFVPWVIAFLPSRRILCCQALPWNFIAVRLDRAEIRNFRSIQELKFVFQPRCRVLVGINESGKSNILQALSFLDPEVELEPGDLREIRPDEKPYDQAYVHFVFKLDAKDKAQVLESIRRKVGGDLKKEPIVRIRKKNLSLSELVSGQIEATYRVDLLGDVREFSSFELPSDAQIIGPWKCISKNSSTVAANPDLAELRIGDPKNYNFSDDELADCTPTDLNDLVAQEFHAVEERQLPTVIFWRYDENQLLPGKINISQFSADPESCAPLKHMFELSGISDIPETISEALKRSNGMRNLLKRVSKISTRHLHQVWKEYRDIDFELIQNGDFIDAHILDRFNTYDLSRRSDGFKRFVAFLLHISVKARTETLTNTLYLDDEPGVGLHPSGARYLRDELVKVSSENYVVYATHSIFMIDGDYLPRHLIVSKRNETTCVEQASESNFSNEEVLFNALGYSIFEQLKSSNIVFEGWRDKRLFEVALDGRGPESKALRATLNKIGRCYANGVKDVGRVTAMLELARRSCVILSDGDQPAREHQRNYKGYGEWLRYDELVSGSTVVTAEDFILSSAFLRVLDEFAQEDDRLRASAPINLTNTHGKLGLIAAWLSRAGLNAQEVKTTMERLKHAVFANLKADQIEASYFDAMTKLASFAMKM